MYQIDEFVDERQKSWCIYCGAWIEGRETNRDHIPSKSLLVPPYPENLPIVQVCKTCNEGFSLDEEYLVAFLGCVLAGSTDPAMQTNPTVKRILLRNTDLRARIERSKTASQLLDGKPRTTWDPERQRIEHVLVKNARGHAFFEYGESLLSDPAHVRFVPLENLSSDQQGSFDDIEPAAMGAWPEVGSRMMTRLVTGQDLQGPWVIVQDNVYRYAVVQRGLMLVKTVLFEYLATEVHWSE